jgi:wyosine [tRNA(Phe)-imidazoG37] synthetase (radical SAM superfamily)
MIQPFKYLYGPVQSWRLGRSLGVDPLSAESKTCNMNCVYCQLGKTHDLSQERREYVKVSDLMEEIERMPEFFIDYITFSGRGEPTLAKNLGEMIRAIKSTRREKIAVITNSTLLYLKEVQDDLMAADFVLIKLDAVDQQSLNRIDGVSDLDFEQLMRGIFAFRSRFRGKVALQIMLLDDNLELLTRLGTMAFFLNPDEVQLNTPIRPCAVQPLSKESILKAKKFFKGVPVISCYDVPEAETVPMDEQATATRHGNYRKSRYVY